MDEYDGRQYVGIDLHRRRSVIVRMTPEGERLGAAVRIDNDPFELAQQVASWGESPEVVLEATYGWYWAADVLADAGATVHLAHPLGVKGFAYRRVKNDERDAADLADLLRMGRLPEAWIAPPEVRGAAGGGAAPVQAGRAALRAQGPGACGVGQAGRAGADVGPVRRRRAASCSTSCSWTRRIQARVRVAAPAHRRVHVRDRRAGQTHQRAELAPPPGFPGDPGHPRCRPGAGRGVRRRDRRRDPLRPARSSCAPGPG